MPQPVKLLLIGHSGHGKTGALTSLIEAGYNLRVADLENGIDIVRNMLRDKKKPELLANLDCKTITDGTRIVGTNMIPTATAWPNLIKTLGNWPEHGNLSTWSTKDILVIDSLTAAGKAAIRFTLNLNGRIANLPGWSDYYTAQSLVENLCSTVCADTVPCNVIVISHVREVAKMRQEVDDRGRQVNIEEPGSRKGYPETGAGKAFSPVVGRYFNTILLSDIEGTGRSARHIIRTKSHENIGLKNTAPLTVPATYPIETGLADYFKAVT